MEKNLIVKMANGFGNQMFLYASAYAFSKKLNYNLLIDDETGVLHDLKKWKKRKRLNWTPKYELDVFTLSSKIADNKFKFLNSFDYLNRKYLKLIDKFMSKKNFLMENLDKNKNTFYSGHYLTQSYRNNIFLEGYFESEKYFKDFREDLIKEFSLKSSPKFYNNIFKKMIDNSNVVSIAFRSNRFTETDKDSTDIQMQKKTFDFEHKVVKYIYRGIDFFKSKIDNPKFLIWSDNFTNLQKYFDPNSFTFVENNSNDKILLDFFLMCQCKYFIVGPTSFHWWPAWLCNHKDKFVVCPKDSELNISSNNDFWPESWIKI
mgnify:CR=1 FL=1